jgi:hypothetical protein
MLIGLGEVVRSVVGEDTNKIFSLCSILTGFGLVRAPLPTTGYDELVDCEPLGARDLHQNARSI